MEWLRMRVWGLVVEVLGLIPVLRHRDQGWTARASEYAYCRYATIGNARANR
jgi:hypothetical protein